jgi:hypothetical protein
MTPPIMKCVEVAHAVWPQDDTLSVGAVERLRVLHIGARPVQFVL